MAQDLNSSKSLRAGLRAAGRIDRWDMEKYPVKPGYNPGDVRMHCVENSEWQKTRLSMKGKDTVEKLEILVAWWDSQFQGADIIVDNDYWDGERLNSDSEKRAEALRWATEVQVGNYMGALRRGGQLNDENQIRKAR